MTRFRRVRNPLPQALTSAASGGYGIHRGRLTLRPNFGLEGYCSTRELLHSTPMPHIVNMAPADSLERGPSHAFQHLERMLLLQRLDDLLYGLLVPVEVWPVSGAARREVEDLVENTRPYLLQSWLLSGMVFGRII